MSKFKVTVVDCSNNEEIVRDATADEIADAKIFDEKIIQQKKDLEAKEAARQAILDRLGITADEAKLLLG